MSFAGGVNAVEILSRALSREIEVDELYRENVADYEDVVLVIVEGYVAGSHMVKNALLAHKALCADKELHQHIFSDVLGEHHLH